MAEKYFYFRFFALVLYALSELDIVCYLSLLFLFKGKCRSRSLLLEKSVFLYQPCAHSSKAHKMETLANNGEHGFSCFVCCIRGFCFLVEYQTSKLNGTVLFSCDNRELPNRLSFEV